MGSSAGRVPEVRIGCCGFPVRRSTYFDALKLVEINSTFYKIPKIATVERWAASAPPGFEFTVKAYQGITHEQKLEVNTQTRKYFEQMLEVCRVLNATILLIQTPPSFRPDRLDVAREFFKEFSGMGIQLVWEVRGKGWDAEDARKRLRQLCRRYKVVHVTDPFVWDPVYVGELAYFRLHGLGKKAYYYEFKNEELEFLADKVVKMKAERVYVLFNNLAMFSDAVRFKRLLAGGSPRIYSNAVECSQIVFRRLSFPTTKREVLNRYWWRVFEDNEGHQARIEELMPFVDREEFKDIVELRSALAKAVRKYMQSKAAR